MAFSDVPGSKPDETLPSSRKVGDGDTHGIPRAQMEPLERNSTSTASLRGMSSPSFVSGTPGGLVELTATVEQLLEDTVFPLQTADALDARSTRDQALKQIQDYVRPRVESLQAPVLVVIGGSTGAGKSTLINSLLGERVTLPGALRPTTRNPVLVHHPEDEEWFASQRILPSLKREHTHSGNGAAHAIPASHLSESDLKQAQVPEATKELRLVASTSVPRGLAIIDSPDVDSMVDSNRELARQLLGAADLWIFLTTAARYADAVPWDSLRSAAARQTEIAVVVDRVDPTAMEVVLDLRDMLNTNDLSDAPLFVIEEQPLKDGFLPAPATAHISGWLAWIMLTPGERDKVVNATRVGAVDALARNMEELAVYSETQVRAQESLRTEAEQAYGRAARIISEETSDGSMLRGEVLSRWQDFVGTGEFMRGVEEKIAAVRDKFTAYFRGKTAAPKVQRAVGDSLYAIVKNQCDIAAETTFESWHSNIAGKQFTSNTALAASSTQLQEQLAYEIRQWQAHVLSLVSETGSSKRSKARALALGTNGLGVALMVVAFATTGGLTGVEVGIAGGTAVLAQRLLESVFGEEAVRKLAQDAQSDLNNRVKKVLNVERGRFTDQLAALGVEHSQSVSLRGAARMLHAGVATAGSPSAGSPSAGSPSAESRVTLTELPAPNVKDGEANNNVLESSAVWFGGSVDHQEALELGDDFYSGAVLYGTAGTRILSEDGGSADLGASIEIAAGERGPWWSKIFRPGGTK